VGPMPPPERPLVDNSIPSSGATSIPSNYHSDVDTGGIISTGWPSDMSSALGGGTNSGRIKK
jgi:hypothetical protein